MHKNLSRRAKTRWTDVGMITFTQMAPSYLGKSYLAVPVKLSGHEVSSFLITIILDN